MNRLIKEYGSRTRKLLAICNIESSLRSSNSKDKDFVVILRETANGTTSAVDERLGNAMKDANWSYTDVMHFDEYYRNQYPDAEIAQYVMHFASAYGYSASIDDKEALNRA